MSWIWEMLWWSLWLYVIGRNGFVVEFKVCDCSWMSKGFGVRVSKFVCGWCWLGKIGCESR